MFFLNDCVNFEILFPALSYPIFIYILIYIDIEKLKNVRISTYNIKKKEEEDVQCVTTMIHITDIEVLLKICQL